MRKIGFIGGFDKSNFVIYLAKLFEQLNYRVLVVDSTSPQKIKYVVPSLNPTKAYITNFENVDFAVGFESWEEIERYLGIKFDTNDEDDIEELDNNKTKRKEELYDMMLIDVDEPEKIDAFNVNEFENIYFVTSFDMFSLRKSLNILHEIDSSVKLTRIIFSYDYFKEDEEFLNHLTMEYNVNWNDYTMYFQILGDDNKVFEENQRVEKIRYKRLTQNYKDSLAYVVQDIDKKQNIGNVKKIMRE